MKRHIYSTTDVNRARSLADHLICCKVDFTLDRGDDSWEFWVTLNDEQNSVACTILGIKS